MSYPKRGDVFWVNLDPTVGAEVNYLYPKGIGASKEA